MDPVVFVLYRPMLPALRAQSIQVVHSAHALASLGVPVKLCYDPGRGDPLAPYGLRPLPTLHLIRLPRGRTLAGLVFRSQVVEAARSHAVFLARSKRYAAELLRWFPRARVVLEAHEVDSELVGDPREKKRFGVLERFVLERVEALVCNCEGVLEGLANLHSLPARVAVVHNASAPVKRRPLGQGIGLAGSLIAGKDLETVARAAPQVGGIDWMGPGESDRIDALVGLSGGAFRPVGAVDNARLGTALQRYRTLVLPLGSGLFGQSMTSPLKAFSYLGAGVPFVGADTPALHCAAPGAFHPYTPGDTGSLVASLQRVQTDEELRQRLLAKMVPRTWAQRAREMEAVLGF